MHRNVGVSVAPLVIHPEYVFAARHARPCPARNFRPSGRASPCRSFPPRTACAPCARSGTDLYGIAGNDNPFNQWLWVWHWWQAFGRSGRFRRYRLHVCVLRDADGRTRAIVPFVLTTWGWGPLAVRALRLYGFRDPMSELRAPLIWPGWEAPAAAALTEMLAAQARMYDWCVLDGLVAGGALSDWFHAHAGIGCWEKPVPDCVLPLPPTWEALRARLSRSMKDNLSYYPRLLQRDGHSWQFESVTDPAALPEALEEFLRLHASRNAMPDAPPHADHFRSPESRAFSARCRPGPGRRGASARVPPARRRGRRRHPTGAGDGRQPLPVLLRL